MMPGFSLLVANYNNGRYFPDCWRSICDQQYSDWEVIIVDDASTDNSIQIIQELCAGDPRVKILRNEENKGCGYTKRRCVSGASAEICAFIDPDDALMPFALNRMMERFDNNADAVLIYSNHMFCDEKLQEIPRQRSMKYAQANDPEYFNLSGAITAFAAFRKSAYDKTEGLDPFMKRAVDQDLYLKLAETGEVIALPEVLYKYRQHSNGISTGTSDRNKEKALFWHWYAISSAAKRRGVNIETLFTDYFIRRSEYEFLNKQLQLITNSRSHRFSRKIAEMLSIFRKSSQSQ